MPKYVIGLIAGDATRIEVEGVEAIDVLEVYAYFYDKDDELVSMVPNNNIAYIDVVTEEPCC